MWFHIILKNVEYLDKGGISTIYKANLNEQIVALKSINNLNENLNEFLNEVRSIIHRFLL